MKKILRQGNIKKFRTKCFCCDTEFEYQSSDLIFIKSLSMVCVECPTCGILIQHTGDQRSNITTETI